MAVALAGTFVMGSVAAQPLVTRDWRVLALADALLVGGLAISIYAAASLRGAFGLAPEARDLVTSGAYRLVRHPLYLGELVAATGALLPVLAPLPILIFALFCLCQFTRAVLEERALTAAFPQYVRYRRQTPSLVPWPRSKARSARPRVTPAGWPAWLVLLPNAASREDEDRALTSRDRVDQEGNDDARQQERAAADQAGPPSRAPDDHERFLTIRRG